MGKQVDGTHYENMPSGYQPWDIIKALRLDYWEGSVLKYVLRAGHKPGVLKSTDLRKAIHQLTEYAEMVEAEEAAHPVITMTPVNPNNPGEGYTGPKVPLSLRNLPTNLQEAADKACLSDAVQLDSALAAASRGGWSDEPRMQCTACGRDVQYRTVTVADQHSVGYNVEYYLFRSHHTSPGGTTWCILGEGATTGAT